MRGKRCHLLHDRVVVNVSERARASAAIMNEADAREHFFGTTLMYDYCEKVNARYHRVNFATDKKTNSVKSIRTRSLYSRNRARLLKVFIKRNYTLIQEFFLLNCTVFKIFDT